MRNWSSVYQPRVWESGNWFSFCICLLFAGYTLKCNNCVSINSWDECKKRKQTVTCPYNYDRCGTIYLELEDPNSGLTGYAQAYVKGCANSYECSKMDCQDLSKLFNISLKASKCEIRCCQSTGDPCNSYPDSHPEALVPTTTFLPGEN